MTRACVLLAEGFEEIEALTPVDYLRRAGIEVMMLGLGGRNVRGSHGIVVKADAVLEDGASSAAWDAVILPGGATGAKRLAGSGEARELVLRHFEGGGIVAAICAAPSVALHPWGLLKGKRFTGYPGSEARVTGAIPLPDRVVVDGNLITSRGPGTAGEFAVAIIAALAGEEAASAVAEGTLLRR